MGLMDFLSSSVRAAVDSVKDGDIANLMEGGLIGNKIKSKQKMAVQQAESRKKPGKLCDSQCPVDDMRCEACLIKQQEIIDGIEGLNALETAINSLKGQSVEISGACSLCGAPVEKGVKECPYCGTVYQAEALLANLPKTDMERDKMLLDVTTNVFAEYTALYKKQIEYKQENVKLPRIMKGFTNIIAANMKNGMDMNSDMIRQGASDNGVSYPTYIAGVMTGQYQSVAMINLQKQLDQTNERLAEIGRQQERSRQIEAERQAKLAKTNQERNEIQSRMFAGSAPQYSGAPVGSCCGSCQYYVAYSKTCLENKYRHPSGPNDYCGSYRSL